MLEAYGLLECCLNFMFKILFFPLMKQQTEPQRRHLYCFSKNSQREQIITKR